MCDPSWGVRNGTPLIDRCGRGNERVFSVKTTAVVSVFGEIEHREANRRRRRERVTLGTRTWIV